MRVWAELHERAFRRLGEAPRLLILDNLGEGVLKPDIYDPANPLYADLLAHYGATAMPCRVGDPDRKGKVIGRLPPHSGAPFTAGAVSKCG
jgi:transposase